MSARELVEELEHLGVRLWAESGKLRFRAPQGVMTDARREALRVHKDQLLELLLQDGAYGGVIPEPENRHEPFPLTDVQSAYILGRYDAFEYGGVACHIYLELVFAELDPARLEDAWNKLIARHDMLRSVIHTDGYQRVLPEVPRYLIEVADLRGIGSHEVEQALAAVRARLGHRIYKTENWPLFELSVTLSDERALLHLSIDFLIADWASIRLLIAELGRLYQDPATTLTPLDVTFRDYVIAERRLRQGSRYERDRDYWWQRIDELPPAPELPLLARAGTTSEGRFTRRQLTLQAELWSALRQRAAQWNVTPSGVVLGAYAEVIARWSRRRTFTLNLTLLNRLPLHPQVSSIVGDFTSVNLLAVDWAGSRGFAERATALTSQLLEDLDHRLCSGVEVMREIVRRRGRNTALMPVGLTSAIGLQERAADDATSWGDRFSHGITQTPQLWIDCQAMDHNGELGVNWDVREGVFPDGLVDDMFAAFEALLHRLAATDEAWQLASLIPLPQEQQGRRRAVNQTSAPLPDALLHESLCQQAMRAPERVAVVAADRTLSFGELLGRATAVAERIQAEGCEARERVAVVMPKGWEQLVGVLGTLLAGATYLPIDVNQPLARRDRILMDAGVRRVLTQSQFAESIDWPSTARCTMVDLLTPAELPSALPERVVGPEELAYVIYTSGTTGSPKGVMITHRSAVNTIEDINRRFAVRPEDCILGLANLGFDLSVYDLFGPLGVGGRIVLPSAERRADPSHWAELIRTHGVTLWNSVPAQLQMLQYYLDAQPCELPSLRLALLSGDWIPVTLPDAIRRLVANLEVISLGGATEAAIWSIFHAIDEVGDWPSIPYGKPLANQSFGVFDEIMQESPEWTPGELYIGGAGLAVGYLGDEGKTAARFIHHPETGERLYRTGDYGRYHPDGAIEFLGREDHQVKIRGHRIELGEIEAAILSLPAIAATVVLVDGEGLQRRLVAFIELRRSGDPHDTGDTHHTAIAKELAIRLAEQLPEYMIPSQIQSVDALPLTDNGKVDYAKLRNRLPTVERRTSTKDTAELRDDLERQVAAIWIEQLELTAVDRDDDFFELGGDSLKVARVVGRIQEEIAVAADVEFDTLLRQMLDRPTVAALADCLRNVSPAETDASASARTSALVALGGSGDGPVTILVHDGGGTLAPYRELVQELAARGPVVGLTAGDAETYLQLEPATLIERRASDYAGELLEQGHSRVRLVGYCAGGHLAAELARRLSESGTTIESLTVISSHRIPLQIADELLVEYIFAHTCGVDPVGVGFPDEPSMCRVLDAILSSHRDRVPSGALTALGDDPQLQDAAQRLERLAQRTPAERVAAIGASLGPDGETLSAITSLYRVFQHNLRAIALHEPTPYVGDMTLVRPRDEGDFLSQACEDMADFWQAQCLGDLQVIEVGSDHVGCMRGAHTGRVTELIAPATVNHPIHQ
jgi:pyochelin synthetase